jgi:hypothetical protein
MRCFAAETLKLLVNRDYSDVLQKIRHSITAAAFLTSVLCIDFACAGPAPALQANRPPVIQQVIGMWEWAPQSEGQLTCIALDEDGDTIEYEWVADNGTISGGWADCNMDLAVSHGQL